jgi:hypothetical protein
VPIDLLAIHLECGFALTYAGNLIGDNQRRPLERVVEASQKISGVLPRGVSRWNAPLLRGTMP